MEINTKALVEYATYSKSAAFYLFEVGLITKQEASYIVKSIQDVNTILARLPDSVKCHDMTTIISSKESREFMDDNNWTCDNHEQIEYELGLEASNVS